ncbi:MAG: hypothetical protein ACUZ8O_01165 [Candidatus Anammoxibacter sp.]
MRQLILSLYSNKMLSIKHENIFRTAIEEGFLKIGRGNTVNLENTFYQWCKDNKKPLVKIEIANKYSHVSIDLITTEYVFTENAKPKMFALLTLYSKVSFLHPSRDRFAFEKVPNEKADELAKKMITIYTSEKTLLYNP